MNAGEEAHEGDAAVGVHVCHLHVCHLKRIQQGATQVHGICYRLQTAGQQVVICCDQKENTWI